MALISHLNKECQKRLDQFNVIQEVLEKHNMQPHQLRDTLDNYLKTVSDPLAQSFNSQGMSMTNNNNMINLNFNLNVSQPSFHDSVKQTP